MPKLFISYARADGSRFAHDVRAKLEENNLEYWLDVDYIGVGEEWPRLIDDALKDSFALVLVLTPSALDSVYVTYEWIFALGRGIKVLPFKFTEFNENNLHPKLKATDFKDFTDPTDNSWGKFIDVVLKARTEYDLFDVASKLSPYIPRYIKNALDELESTNESIRHRAIDSMVKSDHPAALEAIAGVIKRHHLPDVRIYAAFTLAERTDFKDDRALIGLFDGIRDQNDDTRNRPSRMLKNYGSKSHSGLFETLKDSFGEVRYIAVKTLGEIQENSAVPYLLPMLNDPYDNVVGATLDALELIGDSIINAVLKEKLGKIIDLQQQLRICQILFHFKDFSMVGDLARLVQQGEVNNIGRPAQYLLIQIGQDAVPYMITILKDKTDKWWMGRAVAAETLGYLKAEIAIPHLLNALKDTNWYVRVLAAEALGRMRAVETVAQLGELLDDPDGHIQGSAQWALEMINSEEAKDLLSRWRERKQKE